MPSFQYILKSKLCFTRSFQFCVSVETELVEYENITNRRKEGRGGEGGRVLCWERSDFILSRCHVWAKFVVGSRPAPSVFLRVLWFSSLHKTNILDQHRGPAWKPIKADVASYLIIVIYLFIYLLHLFMIDVDKRD